MNIKERLTIKLILWIIELIQPMQYKHELDKWIDEVKELVQE